MSRLSTYGFEQRIDSAYSMAKLTSSSSDQLRDRLDREVWSELNRTTPKGRKIYSSWLHAYARGYQRSSDNRLMQEWVEFCYLGEDGVLYSTHKNTTKHSTNEFYDSNRGRELSQLRGEFYWKHSDKPFTRSTLSE